MTLSFCHDVVRVAVVVAEPTFVVPEYSVIRSLIVAPPVSARTQIDAPYLPAVVAPTQFGASLSVHVPEPVDPLASLADQPPDGV